MTGPTNRNVSAGSHSTTLSEGICRATKFLHISEPTTETTLDEEVDDELAHITQLKRALTTKSIISTTSSFAARMSAESKLLNNRSELRIIGLGSCGTVFEVPGTELAYKKGSDEAALWRDFNLTNTVHSAIMEVRDTIQKAFPDRTTPMTPACHDFHRPDSPFWACSLNRFPTDRRSPETLFSVDRILPLPRQTRESLIAMFFNEDIEEEAKMDAQNKDCLVRIYLGERESARHRSEGYESLRNFELRLNMMEDIGLDMLGITTEIAIGLAILHWQARVDGMDTEFVYGSSATWDTGRPKPFQDLSASPRTIQSVNFTRRETHIWMLDFDKAHSIEFTKNDVTAWLVPAFVGNDPYFPVPDSGDEIWSRFVKTYLKASRLILQRQNEERTTQCLPKFFIDEVIRVTKANKNWDEEQNIVFED